MIEMWLDRRIEERTESPPATTSQDSLHERFDMFYTYIHLRQSDNKVFYVGKGQGKRAWAHKGRNKHWKNIVTKHGLNVEICAQWSTEAEAFDHERFLIASFKAVGNRLANLTDGGEGVSGHLHSEEAKAKMSATNARPEIKQKRSLISKAACARPEVKAKKSAAAKAACSCPDVKAKMSASAKAACARPEVKEKKSKAAKAANSRPEVKAKYFAANERQEVKDKRREGLKSANARPEVKAKRSASQKEAQSRPEVKAKHSAAMIGRVFVNNGQINKRVFLEDGIPEGFERGRCKPQ